MLLVVGIDLASLAISVSCSLIVVSVRDASAWILVIVLSMMC